MSTSTSQLSRCPACDAQVRPGSDWCTLCYFDLRPAPEPERALAALEQPGQQVDPSAPPRGRHARAEPVVEEAADEPGTATDEPARVEPSLPDSRVAQMLAELAATESRSPLGPLAGRLDSPGRRVALMLGGTAAAIALLLLLMAVVGVLL